jgi:transcriptional regulator with XRE-family HTH domain
MFPNDKHSAVINEAEIGKRIRTLRKAQHITLETLASITDFSKGYLSKLEKSKKSPPVSTLGIIARALGVTISRLLGEESSFTPISLVKKNERPSIILDGTRLDYSYEAVAHNFTNKMMEPFVLTLPAKTKKKNLHRHAGQELLFVLEGTMKFLHGSKELIVEEGDCVYFDSAIPHFGESIGNKEVKCFMVIWNPNNNK